MKKQDKKIKPRKNKKPSNRRRLKPRRRRKPFTFWKKIKKKPTKKSRKSLRRKTKSGRNDYVVSGTFDLGQEETERED